MKNAHTHWTRVEAGKVLDRADKAKSDTAYAKARGIRAPRLSWWRKQLDRPRPRRRAATPAAAPAARFVEVAARRPSPPTLVEVVLSNGRQMRVSDQVDPVVLARIADALEGRC